MANEFDGERWGREMAELVKDYLAGFEKRLSALESRTLKYSGVFRDGEVYRAGEMTTYNGSLWHCEATTASKPGTDSTWKLAIKRGEFSK